MKEKLELSFSEISNAIKKYPFRLVELVIGIGRGGIVPASLVAHQLSVDLLIVNINYRDDNNRPRFNDPKLLNDFDFGRVRGKVLVVDDVSVTGKTLGKVKEELERCSVETFVLKGMADHVLFPDINTCVNWPWKILNHEEI